MGESGLDKEVGWGGWIDKGSWFWVSWKGLLGIKENFGPGIRKKGVGPLKGLGKGSNCGPLELVKLAELSYLMNSSKINN